jgi:6-phospho-3-hexuloisomerase
MSNSNPLEPIEAVVGEVTASLAKVSAPDFGRFVAALQVPHRRWFCTGQGRSGLVGQMAAMRLMHLGHSAHVVGEATAPAITAGDALLVVSSSGTTPVTLHFVQTARDLSSAVVLVTATSQSPLQRLADTVLRVPAVGSTQFGGSLFEQAALLVLDAAILALDAGDPDTRDAMHQRHANLR